jgi:hypothetical protein
MSAVAEYIWDHRCVLQHKLEYDVSDLDFGVYTYFNCAAVVAHLVIDTLGYIAHYDMYIVVWQCLFMGVCAQRYTYAGQYSLNNGVRDLVVLCMDTLRNRCKSVRVLFADHARTGIPLGITPSTVYAEKTLDGLAGTKCVVVSSSVFRTKRRLKLFRFMPDIRRALVELGVKSELAGQAYARKIKPVYDLRYYMVMYPEDNICYSF